MSADIFGCLQTFFTDMSATRLGLKHAYAIDPLPRLTENGGWSKTGYRTIVGLTHLLLLYLGETAF